MLLVRLVSTILSLHLASALTLPELRHRTIYQVLTDRFARGDGLTPACDTGRREYCGGTWKGIEARLGYIQDMGFDTGRAQSFSRVKGVL